LLYNFQCLPLCTWSLKDPQLLCYLTTLVLSFSFPIERKTKYIFLHTLCFLALEADFIHILYIYIHIYTYTTYIYIYTIYRCCYLRIFLKCYDRLSGFINASVIPDLITWSWTWPMLSAWSRLSTYSEHTV
jgi:hypothetical protein